MNSFGSRSKLRAGNQEYEIYRLDALDKHNCSPQRLPFSLKILLENLLRTENGRPTSYRFNYKDVASGKNLRQNIELKPGDSIIVP